MANILVIHGPNLNLLGTREPEKYGNVTLERIDADLQKRATAAKHSLTSFQSNDEAQLITRIQETLKDSTNFILINPAAYTHTSIGMRDALLAVDVPFIEVHISNIYKREAFRQQSYFSDISVGVISGFGPLGYELALQACLSNLN